MQRPTGRACMVHEEEDPKRTEWLHYAWIHARMALEALAIFLKVPAASCAAHWQPQVAASAMWRPRAHGPRLSGCSLACKARPPPHWPTWISIALRSLVHISIDSNIYQRYTFHPKSIYNRDRLIRSLKRPWTRPGASADTPHISLFTSTYLISRTLYPYYIYST